MLEVDGIEKSFFKGIWNLQQGYETAHRYQKRLEGIFKETDDVFLDMDMWWWLRMTPSWDFTIKMVEKDHEIFVETVLGPIYREFGFFWKNMHITSERISYSTTLWDIPYIHKIEITAALWKVQGCEIIPIVEKKPAKNYIYKINCSS